jgi:amino acid adenylation domain-containing protein
LSRDSTGISFRNDLTLPRIEAAKRHWRALLAAPRLDLPFNRVREAGLNGINAGLSFDVPAGILKVLREWNDYQAISPFISLLSVFAVLLHRYSGQEEIVIASPILVPGHDDNPDNGLRDSLFLRLELSDNPRFDQLLDRVRDAERDARAIRDFDSSELDEMLHTETGSELDHLGEVAFVSPHDMNTGRILPQSRSQKGGRSCRLCLRISVEDSTLTGTLEYSRESFEDKSILSFVRHFQTLIRSATQSPGARLSQLGMFSDDELSQLLVDWNGKKREIHPRCIHEEFELQAERAPDAIAVIHAGRDVSYYELNARANQLARYLQKNRIGPEVFVGICLNEPLEAIVAIMAIFKAGAAYIPIDPTHPSERSREIVLDSHAATVITTSPFLPVFSLDGVAVICQDAEAESIDEENATNLPSQALPDNAAYVIYTSGSSGKPKGVVGLHRTITSSFAWAVPLDPPEVYAVNSSFTFGSSVLALLFPLISGETVAIIPKQQFKEARQLASAIEANKITRLALVPPQLKELLNMGPRATAALGSIKTLIVSGAALMPETVSSFIAVLPQAKLLNSYSSVEVGVMATRRIVTDTPGSHPMSIGRPVINARVYILDQYLNPTPIGVTGELYVGAADMPRAYLNDPVMTAERFIADPLGGEPGARLFRTGDLARFHPSGEIEYLGRADSQLKIRGIRIEVGEIEGTLGAYEDVLEVAVVGQHGADKSPRLVAYVVPKPGTNPTAMQLRDRLKRRLPEYMLPSYIRFLEQLPRMPNGKVDRTALPPLGGERPRLGTPFAPPRNELEREFAEIWASVLSLEQVGIHDDFLELGGDSLNVTQVISRVWDRFQVELPLEAFFDRSTIAEQIEDFLPNILQ